MTEQRARGLLDARLGSRLCVRYRSSADGRIEFADSSPSPSRWSSLIAAASLLAWVGCASHEPSSLEFPEQESSDAVWLEEPFEMPERTPEPEASDWETIGIAEGPSCVAPSLSESTVLGDVIVEFEATPMMTMGTTAVVEPAMEIDTAGGVDVSSLHARRLARAERRQQRRERRR